MQTVWAVMPNGEGTEQSVGQHSLTAAGCGMGTHIQVCSWVRLALSSPGDCSPCRGQCSWQGGEEESVGQSQ